MLLKLQFLNIIFVCFHFIFLVIIFLLFKFIQFYFPFSLLNDFSFILKDFIFLHLKYLIFTKIDLIFLVIISLKTYFLPKYFNFIKLSRLYYFKILLIFFLINFQVIIFFISKNLQFFHFYFHFILLNNFTLYRNIFTLIIFPYFQNNLSFLFIFIIIFFQKTIFFNRNFSIHNL